VKRSIAIALFAILSSTSLSAVWAIQIENYGIGKGDITNAEIAKALSDPPNVPPESENLVRNFLDHTLPHLLADDERLAYQLGLGDSSDPIIIDRRLPIMLIRRDDIMKLLARTAEPIDLVNNQINWMKDKGRLVPNRIVFSLRRNTSTSDAASPSWSSVTLEQSGEGSWRIIQAGAPKLSRAMTLHKDKDTRTNEFLLWIPDLNRHYLGKIEGNSIVLTVLFYDPVTRSEPGKHQRITDEFLKKLKQLYEKLELPKKLKGQTGLAQTRPDQSNQAQPPAQAQ
jgi:hypothetical protein